MSSASTAPTAIPTASPITARTTGVGPMSVTSPASVGRFPRTRATSGVIGWTLQRSVRCSGRAGDRIRQNGVRTVLPLGSVDIAMVAVRVGWARERLVA